MQNVFNPANYIKRVVIGDPHGRAGAVQTILRKSSPDEVIILGDYFDSFNIHPIDQRFCYETLDNLRRDYIKAGKKFIMLIGNHDCHYMSNYYQRHSGWNQETETFANYFLERDMHEGLLQFIYVDELNKVIYSHAGITNKWLDIWCYGNLDYVNLLWQAEVDNHYKTGSGMQAFEFTRGDDNGDMYGSSVENGCTWIRPRGLIKDAYVDREGNKWTQIFGHTETDGVKTHDDDGKLVSCDCMMRSYYVQYIDRTTGLIVKSEEEKYNLWAD